MSEKLTLLEKFRKEEIIENQMKRQQQVNAQKIGTISYIIFYSRGGY
jgi:hypothetical protein